MSVAENGLRNVEVHPLALSTAPGRMTVATLVSARNPGGTWLLTTAALDAAAQEGFERFDVAVARLDDIAPECCDMVKIDVEGAEYLVLTGGAATIRRLRPVILSEVNPEPLRMVSGVSAEEYVRFVESLGYRAHAINPDGPGPALPAGFASALAGVTNVLFLPG
jgi:FkbM family methyltransferase